MKCVSIFLVPLHTHTHTYSFIHSMDPKLRVTVGCGVSHKSTEHAQAKTTKHNDKYILKYKGFT
jgi:hypothetical protein